MTSTKISYNITVKIILDKYLIGGKIKQIQSKKIPSPLPIIKPIILIKIRQMEKKITIIVKKTPIILIYFQILRLEDNGV